MLLNHKLLFWLATATAVAEAGIIRRQPGNGDGVQVTPLVTTTIVSTYPPRVITNGGISLTLTPAPTTLTTIVPYSMSTSSSSSSSVSSESSTTTSSTEDSTATTSSSSSSSSASNSQKPISLRSVPKIGTIFYNSGSVPANTRPGQSSSLNSTSTSIPATTTSNSASNLAKSTSSNNTTFTTTTGPSATGNFSKSESVSSSTGSQSFTPVAGVAYVTVTQYTTVAPTTSSSSAFTSLSSVAYVTETEYTTVAPSTASSAGNATTAAGSEAVSYTQVGSAAIVNPVASVTQNYTMPAITTAITTSSDNSVSLVPATVVSSVITLCPIPAGDWVQMGKGDVNHAEAEAPAMYAVPTDMFDSHNEAWSDKRADPHEAPPFGRSEIPINSAIVKGLLGAIVKIHVGESMESYQARPPKQGLITTQTTSFSWKWAHGAPPPATWYTTEADSETTTLSKHLHKRFTAITPDFASILSDNQPAASQPPNPFSTVQAVTTPAGYPQVTTTTVVATVIVTKTSEMMRTKKHKHKSAKVTAKPKTMTTTTKGCSYEDYTNVGGWGSC